MAIPPYQVNTPIPIGVPGSCLFFDVWNGTLNNPVISLSGSLLTLNQTSNWTFPNRILLDPTLRFIKTPYAAGTPGVYSLALSGTSPVVGKIYRISLFGGNPANPYSYGLDVIATTTSPSDLATAVNAAIANSGQSSFFTSTVITSTVTINEVNATTGGFTLIFFGDTGYVFSTITPNVLPWGTVAQVSLWKPNITSGTFNSYQWSWQNLYHNFEGSGENTLSYTSVVIWIDTGATNYAAQDQLMTQFTLGGSYWASFSSAQFLASPQ